MLRLLSLILVNALDTLHIAFDLSMYNKPLYDNFFCSL